MSGSPRSARWNAPGRAVARQIRKLLPAGTVKDLLSGTFMGHPLHPLLTEVRAVAG